MTVSPKEDSELAQLLSELATTTDMSPDDVTAAIAAYPQYRDEILRFAVDWDAHEFAPDGEEVPPLPALDLSAYRQDTLVDPFRGKSAAQLKAVAAACDIPLSLLSKLENRAIEVGTIPLLLVRLLASSLRTEISVLLGFLSLPPTLAAGAQYRSDATPQAGSQVSFADAVRSTSMANEQRRRWLDLSE